MFNRAEAVEVLLRHNASVTLLLRGEGLSPLDVMAMKAPVPHDRGGSQDRGGRSSESRGGRGGDLVRLSWMPRRPRPPTAFVAC